MVLIVADKNKYVMLSCQQKSQKFIKGEAVEMDDVNAKFLTEKYKDITFYVKPEDKTEDKKEDKKTDKKAKTDEINQDNK